MANTYSKIYLQFVFAVKYRKAVLDKSIQHQVHGVIGRLINESDGKTLIVNGVEDHVHCLLSLKPTIAPSDLMKIVKSKSSKYINDNNLTKNRFEWQDGFGVFSYGHSQIDMIYNYILNQEEHHRQKTFLDEYLSFLKAFDIDYNELYVFHEPC
jgi:REP element-mobilizing transposase RayT